MFDFMIAFLRICFIPGVVVVGCICALIARRGAEFVWRKLKHEYMMTPKCVFYRAEGIR